MKPDWKDAPAWAQFVAMDSNGEWYWHEHKPAWIKRAGRWANPGLMEGFDIVSALESLEERP